MIIIHFYITTQILHVRGGKGFALVLDAKFYGYLFYIPTKCRAVSSSSFVAIKNDVDIDANEEYDESIFDDLTTTFISHNDPSTLQPNKIEELPSDSTGNTGLPHLTTPSTSTSSSSSHSNPLFTDTMLTQNDVDAHLNIKLTTTSTDQSTDNPSGELNIPDLDTPVTPIDINDPAQLALTPVEPSSTSITASPDNVSLPTSHSTDSSSKLTPIPAESFYVDSSALGGTKSSKEKKTISKKLPKQINSKER